MPRSLVEYEKFDQVHETFMTRFCIVNLTFSITAALGTTVAYIRIYKAIRYHQNRIRVQPQATNQMQAYTAHQEKISAINVMAVNGVCYLLLSILCCTHTLKEIFRLGPAQRPSFMYNRHLNMKI